MTALTITTESINMGTEVYGFNEFDTKGREMGVRVKYTTEVREENATHEWARPIAAGTYLTAWVKACRDGAEFGASDQFKRFEITEKRGEIGAIEARDIWVAQAIAKSRKNAISSRVNRNRR